VNQTRRRGMTMIELLLAVALASILMVALFQLLDVSLGLWSKGEVRRTLVEHAAGVSELFARDVRALHPGRQGDVLVEWVGFDRDRDGVRERFWPRVRLVRQATAAEVARLAGADERLAHASLLEVAWAVVPIGGEGLGEGEARAEGVLLRGEEILGSGDSYFETGDGPGAGLFGADGFPRVGALNEVSGGVLWLGIELATQTTILADGWRIGAGLEDAATSWDAWNRARPDPLVHPWNEPGAGMPAAGGEPLLPRRVRLELEFERPADRKRRPRLVDDLEAGAGTLRVSDGDRIPREEGTHVMLGHEWMEVVGVSGDDVRVKRGARATEARPHAAGEMVHFGVNLVTEIPVAQYKDDWNL